jgi:mitochondrial fission protein ELM1
VADQDKHRGSPASEAFRAGSNTIGLGIETENRYDRAAFGPAFMQDSMTLSSSSSKAEDAEALPRVWLLFDDRPGHRTQVMGIAEALGWPSESRSLVFTPLNHLANKILGASLLSLDRARSDDLSPPWPDLVIAMGRRVVPVVRWIKKQSGGRTRAVLLGRKAANIEDAFDLAVACRHFQLPPHPGRLDLVVPPTQVDATRLKAAAKRWPDLYAGLAEPRVLLLVGGTTVLHSLTAAAAGQMARAAAAFAAPGSLTVVTSRRTGEAAVAAMRQAAPEAAFHLWRRDAAENPYLGYLAGADALIVTGESESMLAEAAASAKPLYIYPLQERPAAMKDRLKRAVFEASLKGGRLSTGLISAGWIEPPRDLARLHREMVESGLAKLFGAPLSLEAGPGWREGKDLAKRIRDLFDVPSGGAT